MTGRSSHTPIFRRAEFARVFAKHDREYPVPYVPPDSLPPSDRTKVDARKPWLKRRPGEPQEQYDHRISHSCYKCGTFLVDMPALDLHEDECAQQGKRGALAAEEEP